jgi:hypothetical protein
MIIYRELKIPGSLDFKVYLFCLKAKSLLHVLGIIILDFFVDHLSVKSKYKCLYHFQKISQNFPKFYFKKPSYSSVSLLFLKPQTAVIKPPESNRFSITCTVKYTDFFEAFQKLFIDN